MQKDLILASASTVRADLLRQAGVPIRIEPAKIDEDLVKTSMQAEQFSHRDIADALADAKSHKLSLKFPDHLVLGCDQVLSFDGLLLSKPKSKEELFNQLASLRGKKHSFFSAAVLYEAGEPQWRHVSQARVTMRSISDDYLRAYVDRNWPDVAQSVGGYQIEAEGIRLISRLEGSHYAVLGLPFIELLNHLSTIGYIPS